jgi:elongation factor G
MERKLNMRVLGYSWHHRAEVAMYYETITRTAEIDFAHKKRIGNGGEFANVKLRLEPLPTGSGLQFVNNLTADDIPAGWIGGVKEGIQEASKTGILAGCPVARKCARFAA